MYRTVPYSTGCTANTKTTKNRTLKGTDLLSSIIDILAHLFHSGFVRTSEEPDAPCVMEMVCEKPFCGIFGGRRYHENERIVDSAVCSSCEICFCHNGYVSVLAWCVHALTYQAKFVTHSEGSQGPLLSKLVVF